MAILGTRNRSENWRTAAYFAPLFGYGSVRLAQRLGERADLRPGDVRLELFWRGVRDYFHQLGTGAADKQETLAGFYSELFPSLKKQIKEFGGDEGFQTLQEWNYDVSTSDSKARLASNLFNTEMDIVLESPNCLFIGEAKHASPFGARSEDVLTHQLMRQYVTAQILLKLLGHHHTVVPFVVADRATDAKRSRQVQFMLSQQWLQEDHILEWRDIANVAYATPD